MAVLKINPSLLGITFQTGTQFTIELEPGVVKEVGNNFSPNPLIASSTATQFSTFSVPLYVDSTGTISVTDPKFITTATLSWDRSFTIDQGNFYIYNQAGIYKVIPANSSTVSVIDNDDLSIKIFDFALPEGNYFLGWDDNVVKDIFGIKSTDQTTDSVLGWSQTSISNMTGSRRYTPFGPYALFTSTTPQVIDISPDANKQYTFTLNSPQGTFTATNGINTGTDYIFTGTRAQINQTIPTIRFTRSQPGKNNNITFEYSLTKDGVLLVDKSVDLFGFPYPLGVPLNLVISSPRVVDENITFTASVNTSTQMAGTVEFYSSGTVIGTGTMSISGVASTVTAFASTGTKYILASWLESAVVDGTRYETINSLVQEIFVDLANRLPNGSLTVQTRPWTTASTVQITATLDTSTQFTGTDSGRVTFYVNSSTFQYDTLPVSYVISATTVTKDINGVFDTLRFTSTSTLPEVLRSNISDVNSNGDRLQLLVNGVAYDNRNFNYFPNFAISTIRQPYYNGSPQEKAFEITGLTTSSLTAAGISFATSYYFRGMNTDGVPTNEPDPFGSEYFDLYFDGEKVTDVNGGDLRWRLVYKPVVNPNNEPYYRTDWVLEPYAYSANWNQQWGAGWLRIDADSGFILYPANWQNKTPALRVSRLDARVNNFSDIYYKLYTSNTGSNFIEVWDASSATQYTNTTSAIKPSIFDRWSSLSTASIVFTATSRVLSTGTVLNPTYQRLRSPTTGAVLGTSTFVNNTATLTVPSGVFVSTGTYSVYASWEGRWVAPKYFGTQSNSVNQLIVTQSFGNLNISAPAFWQRPETGTGTFTLTTASISITGYEFQDRVPTGVVSLFDGATLLGTATLSTSATASISWNPASFSQIGTAPRTLTVNYPGDVWNQPLTTSTTFTATQRRIPSITLTATSVLFERPDPIRLVATTNVSFFNGKTIAAVEGASTVTTTTFTGTQAIFEIPNTGSYSTGTHSIFGKFDGDYNYAPANSNTATFVADKRTVAFTISADKDSPYWINPTYIDVSASNVNSSVKPSSITLKANGSTIGTSTWDANVFRFGPFNFTSSNQTLTVEIPEDTTYKAVTASKVESFIQTPAPQNITQQGSSYTINTGETVTLRIYTPSLVGMPVEYRSGISFEMRPNASSGIGTGGFTYGAAIVSTSGDPFTDGYKEWVVRYTDDGNYAYGIYPPQVVAIGNQYWIGSSYPRFVAEWTVRVNN